MYYVIFGLGLISILPLLFLVIVGSSLIASHITRNHVVTVYTQILCIIYITTFIQWSIGGVFDSGIETEFSQQVTPNAGLAVWWHNGLNRCNTNN